MHAGPLGDADVMPVATAVAAWQRDPTSHVCYVGVDPDTVAEELAQAASWRERTMVARDEAGTVVGAVLADVDEQRGRVWWVGPWGSDPAVQRAVLDAAVGVLPPGVTQHEFAPDARNEGVARLAAALGAEPTVASSVLVLDPLVPPPDRVVPGIAIGPLVDEQAAVVATLHDTLFPNTHAPGATLVGGGGDDVLVATRSGTVVGYVATEVHPDGSLYVDYLGTAPGDRRRGVASLLIGEVLRRGAAAGRERSHLTVRHDAVGARALYLSLGFVEERVITPWRIGFDTG